jgi:hypothetical protein
VDDQVACAEAVCGGRIEGGVGHEVDGIFEAF